MSKIAIISDIHANIDALKLVLEDAEKRGVTQIICLGDLVKKYYEPGEVVGVVRAETKYIDENHQVQNGIVLMGNCDDSVVNEKFDENHPTKPGEFKYKWQRGKLGLDNLEYLASLPNEKQIEVGKALVNLYHSNPKDLTSMYNPLFYENDRKDVRIITSHKELLPEDNKPGITIVGHTHMPYIGIENENGELYVEKPIEEPDVIMRKEVKQGDRTIINVGSAGETVFMRLVDGKAVSAILPYLTYAILDDHGLDQGFTTEIIRVPYREVFKKVFFSAIDKQIEGVYPYSPGDSKARASSILEQNPNNPELEDLVRRQLKANDEAELKRRL